MALFIRGGILVLALVLSAASTSPPGPPEPDSCDAPTPRGALMTVALGESDADESFVAWPSGSDVEVLHGIQGGTMIAFRVRVTGSELAECMPQVTRVYVTETLIEIASEDQPLKFHMEADGSRITVTNYLIFEGGAPPLDGLAISVDTEVGGLTDSVSLRLVDPDAT